MAADAREIAALVPMPRLLEALRIEVNERTRRAPCALHRGSNRSAFSWREDGLWRCHSCGAGGDQIALVRSVRKCGFRDAVAFLAQLAGIEYRPGKISRAEIEAVMQRRQRVERAAWLVADKIGRLRRYYTDGLHRAERLQRRVGAGNQAVYDSTWERLARLGPATTFFLAAWRFIFDAKPDELARFALASTRERRRAILGGDAL